MLAAPRYHERLPIDQFIGELEKDTKLLNDPLLTHLLQDLKQYISPSPPGTLDLSHHDLGQSATCWNPLSKNSSIQLLTLYLPFLKSVKHLNLSQCSLNDNDVTNLIKGINYRNHLLCSVNIDENIDVSPGKKIFLEKALEKNRMRSFLLSESWTEEKNLDQTDPMNSSILSFPSILNEKLQEKILSSSHNWPTSEINKKFQDFLWLLSDLFQNQDSEWKKKLKIKTAYGKNIFDFFFLRAPLLQYQLDRLIQNSPSSEIFRFYFLLQAFFSFYWPEKNDHKSHIDHLSFSYSIDREQKDWAIPYFLNLENILVLTAKQIIDVDQPSQYILIKSYLDLEPYKKIGVYKIKQWMEEEKELLIYSNVERYKEEIAFRLTQIRRSYDYRRLSHLEKNQLLRRNEKDIHNPFLRSTRVDQQISILFDRYYSMDNLLYALIYRFHDYPIDPNLNPEKRDQQLPILMNMAIFDQLLLHPHKAKDIHFALDTLPLILWKKKNILLLCKNAKQTRLLGEIFLILKKNNILIQDNFCRLFFHIQEIEKIKNTIEYIDYHHIPLTYHFFSDLCIGLIKTPSISAPLQEEQNISFGILLYRCLSQNSGLLDLSNKTLNRERIDSLFFFLSRLCKTPIFLDLRKIKIRNLDFYDLLDYLTLKKPSINSINLSQIAIGRDSKAMQKLLKCILVQPHLRRLSLNTINMSATHAEYLKETFYQLNPQQPLAYFSAENNPITPEQLNNLYHAWAYHVEYAHYYQNGLSDEWSSTRFQYFSFIKQLSNYISKEGTYAKEAKMIRSDCQHLFKPYPLSFEKIWRNRIKKEVSDWSAKNADVKKVLMYLPQGIAQIPIDTYFKILITSYRHLKKTDQDNTANPERKPERRLEKISGHFSEKDRIPFSFSDHSAMRSTRRTHLYSIDKIS
jgi:hypothetical protein